MQAFVAFNEDHVLHDFRTYMSQPRSPRPICVQQRCYVVIQFDIRVISKRSPELACGDGAVENGWLVKLSSFTISSHLSTEK